MKLKTLTSHAIQNKTVIVRVDYNTPLIHMANNVTKVADPTRINLSVPTIKFLREHNCKIILISHLGRPKNGPDPKLSLEAAARFLKQHYRFPVQFVPETIGERTTAAIAAMKPGDVILLENLRFDEREKKNHASFAKALADLADVYVNDAFSTAHRSHASTTGISDYIPAFAGLALQKEVETLVELTEHPKKPLVVVLGGAKISDKVGAAEKLTALADIVLVGGAVANNFLKAEGLEIHKSFIEDASADLKKQNINYITVAQELMEAHRTEKMLLNGYIPLPKIIYPIDVIAAPSLDTKRQSQVEILDLTKDMADTPDDEDLLYLDIGPKTVHLYSEILKQAETVFWNGPMGVWENPLFENGSKVIGKEIGKVPNSIIGGGDTISCVNHFNLEKNFTYISGAGGATLEFLGGEDLPGLQPLIKR
ncbi:MAG: phosphoglycerate kinase [Candidatus Pacebacteria bacterium CG_4_9_14_3_um_filter_40_12]|nr:MAG: phosphoglycerate kinase [Candidatus Pacebacteria bacterium CG10_big_fil_rev_8_21_14_0_10_40_26]PIZ79417.1 MAG: phosphoglycerate kinase [Candidatus Pacebacteria bacterium CG_4_10_14_0_2_um_filter_40_20]PJA68554.1 MAG: phosphoglycerate kinase [Candidatus Pacebacteria bacterium CG_4_9_14_3_um_filter_40_12]PJC41938.1 MAG: phosphoglycerate kinase [Candidatus Pacebacteria bacterium CG_4_9_14_0_2_um_filter_40_15]